MRTFAAVCPRVQVAPGRKIINIITINMGIMKKVLFVIGSLRKQSFNRQVSEYVKVLLGDRAEITELEYADLPFVNQDTEFPTPDTLTRVRKEVLGTDLIWVFTPEYNASYPAAVKNLFDWLSRPMTAEPNSATAIKGKKVALTGIGGSNQTKGSREKLTALLNFIGAVVMENQVGLAVNAEAWTSNKVVLSDEQKAMLRKQAEDMLAVVG